MARRDVWAAADCLRAAWDRDGSVDAQVGFLVLACAVLSLIPATKR